MENVFHVGDVVLVFLYKDAYIYSLFSSTVIPIPASFTAFMNLRISPGPS